MATMRPAVRPAVFLLLLALPGAAAAAAFAGGFDGPAVRSRVLQTIWSDGAIPTRAAPDAVGPLSNASSLAPHATQLTWNVSGDFFPLTATAFHNPRQGGGVLSDTVVVHHHGHAQTCDNDAGCPIWFDFYNLTTWIHDELEADYFMLYMPLLGPNEQHGYPTNHEWFAQWEAKGDRTIRYFVEPLHLTINYALSLGYKRVVMMGKSGGGWTTTVCAALDPRISVSFPIAGSIPLNFHHVSWDYEQIPQPNNTETWYLSYANYTSLYKLAAWEPDRFSLQVLHENDPCCFAGHDRHEGILEYDSEVREVLLEEGGGLFSTAITNWSVHAVCPMDKLLIQTALVETSAAHPDFDHLPCDVLRSTGANNSCPFAPTAAAAAATAHESSPLSRLPPPRRSGDNPRQPAV